MKLDQVISYSQDQERPLVHIASINKAIFPDGTQGEIAICKCGVILHHFQNVSDVGENYSNGKSYKRHCLKCEKYGLSRYERH